VPNPTSSSSATEVFEIRTRAGMSSLVADRTRIRGKTSDTERPCRAPFIWITVQVPVAAHGATETHFMRSAQVRMPHVEALARAIFCSWDARVDAITMGGTAWDLDAQ